MANQMVVLRLLLLWYLLAVAGQYARASEHEWSDSAGHLRGRMAIVNGQQVMDQRYFAHQVAIFDEGVYLCGGSIISPDYILTAAHALTLVEYRRTNDSSWLQRKYHKFDTDPKAKKKFWTVRYGARDYNSSAMQTVRVAEMWIHKDYVLSFNDSVLDNNGSLHIRHSNDLAILRLASPVTFSDTVRSISLSPDDSYLEPGDDLTVTGWGGMLTNLGPFPSKLQALTVDHRPDYCDEMLDNRGYTFVAPVNFSLWYDRKEIVCAGCPQMGSGSCYGDSGGPLIVMPVHSGCPVQVGVVQQVFPLNGLTSCGLAGADLYARVSSNLPWIEHMVKQPLRSTVVAIPTQHCETCLGNDHPSGEECQKAQKYDVTYCQVQARLASSFVLEPPTCEGGKQKLKAYIDLNKALAGISSSTMADAKDQLKNGHVIFLVTDKGTGNGVIHIALKEKGPHMHYKSSQANSGGVKPEARIAINTPLKKPKLASKRVSFDSKEEGWVHLVSGCSSKSTYAALYILSPNSGETHPSPKHAYYQISLPVGKLPVP